MNSQTDSAHWMPILRPFLERYSGKLTRLGVFEHQYRGVTDYWIENGLPFTSLDVAERAGDIRVTITLGGFRREIKQVSGVALRLGINLEEEGIDIIDASGTTTVLRFEKAA